MVATEVKPALATLDKKVACFTTGFHNLAAIGSPLSNRFGRSRPKVVSVPASNPLASPWRRACPWSRAPP